MPIITISRGSFASGQALAECLAERLGYLCLSREAVLDWAAASYRVPVEKLASSMDKAPSIWERLIGDRVHYVKFIRAALLEHAWRDKIVFHGYVGHLLMAGISHVIRIRVVEEMDVRIGSAMRKHHLPRDEATERIRRIDRQRSNWTRFLWGVDWQDPSLYDAVLNLTRMDVAGACDVVESMTRQEIFRPTAESLKALEDLTLSSRVWATLAIDHHTADSDLEVSADSGVVIITGTAGSWETADAIPLVARDVDGVRDIVRDIRVAPSVYDTTI